MIEKQIYSISEVNNYIKSLISNDPKLKYIYVKGEISNLKQASNGHLYFSLKDNESYINAVMFSLYTNKLIFTPNNGDEVVVLASLDVYQARGTYQLICYEMNNIGLGTYLIELEKLKKKLQAEGLFDISKKREINLFPKNIGVITAKNSAAIKDILSNIKRRYPLTNIYVFYSAVQGENAPKELLKAFNMSQQFDLDTLIIGRGGGASEDLSAFNDETLVRAVSASKIPVISAVGHEIDTTLIDYVSDKRASTPTGAAELATIDIRELLQKFSYQLEDMYETIKTQIDNQITFISIKKDKLNNAIINSLTTKQNKLLIIKEKLESLNYKKMLSKGYSITLDKNGYIIRDIKQISSGDTIKTIFNDASVTSEVKKVEENKQ